MSVKLFVSAVMLHISIVVFGQNEVTSNPALDKKESEVNLEESFAAAQKEMLIGKIDKAISMYEALYKEDRTNGTVAFELVKAYAQKKDFFSVEKFAKVVLENEANNKWMLEYIAGYMFDNNRPGTAYDIYQRLVTLDPNEKIHYENAANSLIKQDKISDAISVYNAMEITFGPSAQTNMKRYELYDLNGNDLEAVKQLDLLIAKYPENKSYLKTKARHLIKKNKIEDAMVLYKKVLTLDAEDTDANLAVLSKGEDKEKPSAYLMALLPIITNQSINIDVKIKELLPYLQNLKKEDNQEVKAAIIDLADKLVLTHPDEAKAYSLYGDVLMITGDINAAVNKYEHTLKLNNKIFAVWEQLMYGYLELQNYEALSKLSNQAIDLYPNQAINFFFASLCNTYKKNYTEAQSLAEEGLVVSGGNKVSMSKINAALSMAYLGRNDLEKAEASAEKAIGLSDNLNTFAYEIMGDIQLAKGNPTKAKENWIKSADLGNKSKQLLAKIQ